MKGGGRERGRGRGVVESGTGDWILTVICCTLCIILDPCKCISNANERERVSEEG